MAGNPLTLGFSGSFWWGLGAKNTNPVLGLCQFLSKDPLRRGTRPRYHNKNDIGDTQPAF